MTLLLAASSVFSSSENDVHILKRLDEFMKDPQCDQSKMRSLLESGKMDGFFTADEVKLIFGHLSEKYHEYVSSKVIGHTVHNNDLFAYYLASNKGANSNLTKSKVLFTGAHHAREVITTNMIVKIFLETLHSLVHKHQKLKFWNYCDVIIVPIVNLDSYQMISKSFGTSKWRTNSMKRKNMNKKYCR